MILEEDWEKLVKQPQVANVSMLREFYVNIPTHRHHRVTVRSKLVPCGVKSINAYYDVEDESELDDYENLVKSPDLQEIINFLTDSLGLWKKNSSNEVKIFSSSTLTASSKVWHQFTSVKLLPSCDTSEVMKERYSEF